MERRLPNGIKLFVYPEGRAALAAARQGGRLNAGDYDPAISVFQTHFDDLITVGVDHDLAEIAGEQADALGLRGYDAVHLATALCLGEATFVTWDRDLADAAASAGLAVAGAPV